MTLNGPVPCARRVEVLHVDAAVDDQRRRCRGSAGRRSPRRTAAAWSADRRPRDDCLPGELSNSLITWPLRMIVYVLADHADLVVGPLALRRRAAPGRGRAAGSCRSSRSSAAHRVRVVVDLDLVAAVDRHPRRLRCALPTRAAIPGARRAASSRVREAHERAAVGPVAVRPALPELELQREVAERLARRTRASRGRRSVRMRAVGPQVERAARAGLLPVVQRRLRAVEDLVGGRRARRTSSTRRRRRGTPSPPAPLPPWSVAFSVTVTGRCCCRSVRPAGRASRSSPARRRPT